jgi:hypothetical protein
MRRILITGIITVAGITGLAAAQESPNVRHPGKYIAEYKDDKVQVVLGLRYANTKFPSEWLLLQAAVSATGNKPIRIDREDVALVVPGGTRVQMASQKALAEGLPTARRDFQEADVKQDPIEGYFVGPSRQQRLGFFAVPTEQITYEQVTTDRSTIAEGYLFFRAPNEKLPPGRYVLEIFNKDVDVKLPFWLPADKTPPRERVKGDKDKTVPW